MKLDLLTNATVVDDAIRFVEKKSKEDVENLRDDEKIQQQPNDDNRKTTLNQVF